MNSGVTIKGDYGDGDSDYYGILRDILEVTYITDPSKQSTTLVAFMCDWFDNTDENGIRKIRELGVVEVNKRSLKPIINDSFILASQAHQVFYTKPASTSRLDKNWLGVSKARARHMYDVEVENFAYQEADNQTTNIVPIREDLDTIQRLHLINNQPVLVQPNSDHEMSENEDDDET